MHVYCLYGHADRCKSMASTLEKQGAIRAFSPQVIQNVWKAGVPIKKERDLLTGYVFAFYRDRIANFQPFYDLDGFVRKIGDRTMNWELCGQDLDFALTLYGEDGVIRTVSAVWDGETLQMDDDLFNRFQARVIYWERKKKRAKIEFKFEDVIFTSWVALEVEDISGHDAQTGTDHRENQMSDQAVAS